MLKKKYKAVVVGCGAIGALLEADLKRPKPATHAGAFHVNKKTELVALVDSNQEQVQSALKLFPSARGYSDIDECLKKEAPDIVAVATRESAHLAIIKTCVQAGIRIIICEKPLAVTLAEAEIIGRIVEENNVTFVLNYQRRFFPIFKEVRDEIRAGKLGRIQQVTCYYSNGLYNNGGHTIDALSYLLGEKVVSVLGIENVKNTTHPPGDKNIDGIMVTEGGVVIMLQSLDQQKYGIHDFRIYGEKGAVVITDYGYRVLWITPQSSVFGGVSQLAPAPTKQKVKKISMVQGTLQHALESFEKKSVSESNSVTGIMDMQILEALSQSAQGGGKKIAL